MPSKKGIDQALTWLRSKSAEKNTLDGINAELCINVIVDLQRQYDRMGAKYGYLQRSKREKEAAENKDRQLSFLDSH